MLFNSIEFFIFLPIVVALYGVVPQAIRWVVLLVASYYFYMSWKWEYGLLVAATTFVNYAAAIALARVNNQHWRTLVCGAAVSATLAVLFAFKYLGFASESVNSMGRALVGHGLIDPIDLVLPVGISFYTFQTLSYTIDVYRKHYNAVTHLGKFALYIVFFPQLVAGPIERPQNLLPQLLSPPPMNPTLFGSGLRLILWGLVKKVVVADHLAMYVNVVYNDPGSTRGVAVILATLFFAIQIYCDFSGYSDIAIGTARLLGIRLMDNFRLPYFATSIQDFWRRWHISLSSWFRDYLYIPLGGNRGGVLRQNRNLFITFLVSGLWHGAAWTFVIWGAIHGLFMIAEQCVRRSGGAIGGVVGWAYTMCVVNVAWMFFRANRTADIPILFTSAIDYRESDLLLESLSKFDNVLCPVLAVGLLAAERIGETDRYAKLFDRSLLARFSLYSVGVSLIAIIGVFGRPSEFIYFQF